MNQTLEDKVAIIRENIQAGRADLLEVAGSFRADFESGHTVYIYVETYDNSITARFETREKETDKRQHDIDTLRDVLVKEIGFADISEFVEVQSSNNRYVYTARVDIDESVFFHETIVMEGNKTDSAEIFSVQEAKQESVPDLFEVKAEKSVDLSPIEAALERLETIDAKMLRQSLDMMNLKRSSNVRMALTRIFRSAEDAEELTLSIQNEAKKLISRNDHEDLRMIKTINADGFLEPVIELLSESVFGRDLNT